jgi:phosphopentomutase
MVMGAGPELHGFDTWGSKIPDHPSRVLDEYGMFPTVYGLLRKKMPNAEIGVIYEWEGIGYLFPKAAVNYDKHTSSDTASTTEQVNYLLSKKPNFLFAYFHNVDVTGHEKGHDTPEYYAAVKTVDEQIGEVLKAIRDADMEKHTIVILTADHGGIGKGHGSTSMEEMQIPWIIAGPGIKQNYQLQSSIMTFDTAATIARIFNLAIPQVWTGKAVSEAFK